MRPEPEPIPSEETDDIVIPVVEEEIATGIRAVKTGAVRVDKHVEKRVRRVHAPLIHEDVEVRRVPINRVITAMPKPRKRGGTVIVPVVEEEIVVTKRLVLKEEIHMVKRRTRQQVTKEVEVNREQAVVRRLDKEGRVLGARRGDSRF
jgi:uncharacterized protein (TIGR02271 family)